MRVPPRPPHAATIGRVATPFPTAVAQARATTTNARPPHPACAHEGLPFGAIQRSIEFDRTDTQDDDMTSPAGVFLMELSRHFDAYVRSRDKEPQETQAMYVNGCVVVTCNNEGATTELWNAVDGATASTLRTTIDALVPPDPFANKKKPKGYEPPPVYNADVNQQFLAPTNTPSDPVVAFDAGSPNAAKEILIDTNTPKGSLIVLKGQKAGKEATRHAEQNLLLMLGIMLRDLPLKQVPEQVWVCGKKRPCAACLNVLTAYADAFEVQFRGLLHYNPNVGKIGNTLSTITQLDIKTTLGASSTANTKYAGFVSRYERLRDDTELSQLPDF
jgi:hypothetical protein